MKDVNIPWILISKGLVGIINCWFENGRFGTSLWKPITHVRLSAQKNYFNFNFNFFLKIFNVPIQLIIDSERILFYMRINSKCI
jgi:hypothetical protein